MPVWIVLPEASIFTVFEKLLDRGLEGYGQNFSRDMAKAFQGIWVKLKQMELDELCLVNIEELGQRSNLLHEILSEAHWKSKYTTSTSFSLSILLITPLRNACSPVVHNFSFLPPQPLQGSYDCMTTQLPKRKYFSWDH